MEAVLSNTTMSWRLNDDDYYDNDISSDDMLMMMMMTIMIIWAKTGFILECGLAGFPQFGKKCRTLPRQIKIIVKNNHIIKNRPKDKYYFFKIKYSIRKHQWQQYSFDGHSINLLWTFIASYCLNCLSLLRLSHYFTRQTSGILQFWFEPRLFQLPRMFRNGGKVSGESGPCRMSKV